MFHFFVGLGDGMLVTRAVALEDAHDVRRDVILRLHEDGGPADPDGLDTKRV
jgi:hypothetical protein